jgi:hypothetical protein
MATAPEHALAHPLMLNDLDEEAPIPLLERQASGFFELVSYSTRDDAEDSQLMEEPVKPVTHGQDNAEADEKAIEERPGWLMRVFRCLRWCLERRRAH